MHAHTSFRKYLRLINDELCQAFLQTFDSMLHCRILLSTACLVLYGFSVKSAYEFSLSLSNVLTCPGISTYKTQTIHFCKGKILIITIINSKLSHFLTDTLTAGWTFSIAKQTSRLMFVWATPACKQCFCFCKKVQRPDARSSYSLLIFFLHKLTFLSGKEYHATLVKSKLLHQ